MRLPSGIAAVRVEHPGGSVVMVSDRLTREEEWAARRIASEECEKRPLSVVTERQVWRRVYLDRALVPAT